MKTLEVFSKERVKPRTLLIIFSTVDVAKLVLAESITKHSELTSKQLYLGPVLTEEAIKTCSSKKARIATSSRQNENSELSRNLTLHHRNES